MGMSWLEVCNCVPWRWLSCSDLKGDWLRNPTQENSNFKNSHSNTTENRPGTPWQTQLYLDLLQSPQADKRIRAWLWLLLVIHSSYTMDMYEERFFGMNRELYDEAFFYGQNGWGYKSLSIRPSPLSIASQSLHGNCQDALSWGHVTSTFSRNQSALSTPASMLSCPMLCKIGEHIVML